MEASSTQHVLVVGAGIIGLACALALRDAGCAVTVVERGRVMEQSSWAAAGMLAVEDPENAPALLPLARFSRSLYPQFLDRIASLTGTTVPLRTSRTLQGHRSHRAGTPPEALPTLRTGAWQFQLLEEASLDPRDLCGALPRALSAAGVALREQVSLVSVSPLNVSPLNVSPLNVSPLNVSPLNVSPLKVSPQNIPRLPLEDEAAGCLATLSDGTVVTCDHCVLAAGAWSGGLEPFTLPIVPRKGQMIEITLDGPTLPLVIRTPELYLVPRGDGRVVIGATVEDAGFDRTVDEAAGNRLWHAAAQLWPPILEGSITSRWTGLRPGIHAMQDDGLPVIGSVGPRLWAATGHFRNGILLAPGTASILCQLIESESPSLDVSTFSPQRFAALRASHNGATPIHASMVDPSPVG